MVRNDVLKAGEGVSIAGSVAFLVRYTAELLLIRQQADPIDGHGKQKLFPENKIGDSPPHLCRDK
jgi:hypothetical protein